MADSDTIKKEYDFADRDHKAVLTPEQFEHFDEGMRLMNESPPADQIDMKRAAESAKQDLDRLFS